MSKAMTPSEIADWLDAADRAYNAAGSSTSAHPTDKFAQAAATIRELEALGNERIKSHQETLDRERVALTKLKIATEALEDARRRLMAENSVTGASKCTQALARIKEQS